MDVSAAENLAAKAKEAAKISDQDATDVFAEVKNTPLIKHTTSILFFLLSYVKVSNCIIAATVDRAIETLSGDESYTIEALDQVDSK